VAAPAAAVAAAAAAAFPGWGDYCVLTSDYAEFGAAAAGPLEEGNLGVVVGVDHLPDTQQGLAQPRYCVRTHYNGLLYRWGVFSTCGRTTMYWWLDQRAATHRFGVGQSRPAEGCGH
jgi:hypothetical protein